MHKVEFTTMGLPSAISVKAIGEDLSLSDAVAARIAEITGVPFAPVPGHPLE